MEDTENLHFTILYAVWDKVRILFYHKLSCAEHPAGPPHTGLIRQGGNTLSNVGVYFCCRARVFLGDTLNRCVKVTACRS